MVQILSQILVQVAFMDDFATDDWAIIPKVDREPAIKSSANLIASKATTLVWKSLFCTAPKIIRVTVNIKIDCITHIGTYRKEVIPIGADFISQTPELCGWIDEKSKEVKTELTAMLTDLAAAHFDGETCRGGGPYVITPRD